MHRFLRLTIQCINNKFNATKAKPLTAKAIFSITEKYSIILLTPIITTGIIQIDVTTPGTQDFKATA